MTHADIANITARADMKEGDRVQWTVSQSNAINDDRGRSLLVSAGAGSGKTSVLTERLVRMITQGASLDDFLVVTYTTAAAADLKEKLYDKLSKASAADTQNRHLYNQLFLLSGARISTIHSFCYELVKHNFNSLGISAECRVIDQAESVSLLSEVLNDMLDELFSVDDKDVILVLERLCPHGKERELIRVLTTVYEKIRAFYRYDLWFEQCERFYRDESKKAAVDLFATDSGRELYEYIHDAVKDAYVKACKLCELLAAEHATENNLKLPLAYRAMLSEALDAGTFTALVRAFSNDDLPNMNTNKLSDYIAERYKSTRAELKKDVETVQKVINFGTDDFETLFADCADVVRALSNLIANLDKRFFAAKQKRGGLDFADLEQLTLKLLEADDGKPTEICLKLRASFKQVFVDEYQDVNPLQDRIFSLLSQEGNRFTVGDTKQSIYRFRNAYPSIFIGYKNAYGDYETGVKNAVIYLRENFRCSKNIIDFTNLVTEYASKGSDLEDEYKNEALVFSRAGEVPDHPVVLAHAFYEVGREDKDGRTEAIQHCADFVASEIKKLSANGIQYKDIALIFSALKGTSIPYESALARAGIPYRVMKSTGFLTTPEITLALSCISAIDNPTDDIALFSMMRSPMFGFDADMLYKIRRSNDAYSFITCIRRFAHGLHRKRVRLAQATYRIKSVSKETKTLELFASKFLCRLDAYRTMAGGMQAHRFIRMFYETSGLLTAAAAEGEHQKANLLRLYQEAASFESRGFKGVSAFRAYTERLLEDGADLSGAQPSDDDCVKLMTIHASKGLEFPVCFYIGADHNFNREDINDSIHIAHQSGLSFTLNYPDELRVCDTPTRRLSISRLDKESRAEELRKLYVALTRAKDRLYVVSTSNVSSRTHAPGDATSANDWIFGAIHRSESKCYDFHEISCTKPVYGKRVLRRTDESIDDSSLCMIGFEYQYSQAADMPAKISVSQLEQGSEHGIGGSLRVPSFAGAGAGQKGTANHLFMQFCDMRFAKENGAKAEADRLLQERFISKEQYSMLDFKALDKFFAGSLYDEMQSSERVYRERRFSILDNGSIIGKPNCEELLVQGVIDCFYKTDKGLVIVDYKTDRIFGHDAENELVKRHGTQIRYYAVAAERMTGIKVCRAVIYSFALGREVEVEID